MRTVALVQARMGSRRLPGKVLRDLSGAPMLSRIIDRLVRCARLDDVVVATSTERGDDCIADLTDRLGVSCFRGPEHDVLARYVGAATWTRADVVVRVTADCPLIDPAVVDRVVARLLDDTEADYAANVVERSFPRGLDVEAMHVDVLLRIDRLARDPRHREHVTLLARERGDLFQLRSVTDPKDNSDLRWTVDTPDDFELVERLYRELGLGERQVSYYEVIELVRQRPDLTAINADVLQCAV